MLVSISVGDPYHEGHGNYKHVQVFINKPIEEILEAYQKVADKVGFCLFKDFCTETGDDYISGPQRNALRAEGVDLNSALDDSCDNYHCDYGMNANELARIYLEMAASQLDGFEYVLRTSFSLPELLPIPIGYGLY